MTNPDAIRSHALGVELQADVRSYLYRIGCDPAETESERRMRARLSMYRAVSDELVGHCAYLRDERDRARLWTYGWAGAAITLAVAWLVYFALR